MGITVTRRHPLFFAEISGIDLGRPMTADGFAEIETAFHEHAVLLFRDQHLDDAGQVDFSAHFGPVQKVTNYAWRNETPRIRLDVTDISNIDHEGRIQAANDQRRQNYRGNLLWHTDNSFKHVPARCSLLSAREIPSSGGDTEFADMRAAYDALPADRKADLEDLVVEHSIFHSRARLGFTDFSDTARAELPPVNQVLVRQHPGSGRKALYLASHAARVVGWPEEKGWALLDELIEFATQPQFVHRHAWRVGDLIVWDNRCTMHRARPFDDMGEARVLHRTTVSDEVNTVERAGLTLPATA